MDKTTQTIPSFKIIFSLCAVIFIDYFALTLSFPLLTPLFSLDVSNGGLALGQESLGLRNFLYGLTMAMTIDFILEPVVGGIVSNKKFVPWFGLDTPFFLARILSILNILSAFKHFIFEEYLCTI